MRKSVLPVVLLSVLFSMINKAEAKTLGEVIDDLFGELKQIERDIRRDFHPAPGPEMGAGLPLIVAGGYWVWCQRRRKKEIASDS
jgi:MYXO-CTERM domain-containing protein